jgi:transcriptional regulator with XRE-family HTH domain
MTLPGRVLFGRAVRARREALGLSQEKLAELARCDRQSISRVENAAYSPALDRIILLAEALRVPVADLFAEPAPPPDHLATPPRKGQA